MADNHQTDCGRGDDDASKHTKRRFSNNGTKADLPRSVWSKGKATISILQRHIDEAIEKNSSHCATAEAIKEQVPEARFISVDLQTVRWTDAIKKVRFVFLTPHAIQSGVIVPFDQGEREKCRPVTVTMRPCTVIKSGKKRTHTPDADQLKGLNLRVAADQPHIDAKRSHHAVKTEPPSPACGRPESRFAEATPAERELLDHWKPTDHERDPWAHDGPIAPPRKPRQARAKVSAATKGAIPVTLGGRLPPVSVLSRREFGIRCLKR
jgi:hypothetical protein